MSSTILITGGAGFIGSNFIQYLTQKHSKYQIVNLDKLTYAGKLSNLEEVSGCKNYTFIKGDICNKALLHELFEEFKFTGVINFAAESHVDNSINSPDSFISTNIVGTHNLLNVAYKNWMSKPFEVNQGCKANRFHHISTDEVYGSLGPGGFFTEDTPYAPNSPYSASKAASDFLVRSYHETYGLNVVTTNCSNNFGPKQHDEKFIPTLIRKALSGQDIPIYGNGKNVRDWLHVEDHCTGIDLVFHFGKSGETYNIGANNEFNNLEIAQKVCAILDGILPKEESYIQQLTFVKDRPGHDFRYAIDASKISEQLDWKPKESFEKNLENTITWYVEKYRNTTK